MSKIKDLWENPHPIYCNNVSFWNFLLNSYEGGQDYIGQDFANSAVIFAGSRELNTSKNSHLFKYKSEREEDYKKRIQMSYYYNFCAPIIDIYTAHLFKNPVQEDWKGIESAIEQRSENIDQMGSSINEFRKELVDVSQIFGHTFVVVDAPKTDVIIHSQQDKIDTGNFPYLVQKHPQDIVNWSLDAFGRPYWVVVRESIDENINPMEYDKDKNNMFLYKLWDRKSWTMYDADGNIKATGDHNLGYVPIVPFYNKKSKKVTNFLGVSVIADIAFIARDIYNACSELRQMLREQTFGLLVLQGRAEDYSEKEVGTNRGLVYPSERNQPAFISPDSAPSEAYYKHIMMQISAMFRLAKLEGASAKFEGSQTVEQSGISKAYDFNETNQALAEKAMNMTDGEMRMWNMFAGWESKKFEGYVKYPNEFNVKSLNEDLDEAERLLKLNLGKLFDTEVKKTLIEKKFTRMPDDQVDKIVKDMEVTGTQTPGGSLFSRLPGLNKTSDKTV